MRKTLLLTVIFMLLAGGAAWAQTATATVNGQSPELREGGRAEEAGSIFLSVTIPTGQTQAAIAGATIVLRYSVPIASATTAASITFQGRDVEDGDITIDHETGTITLEGTTGTGTFLVISGVLLDLKGESGTVTVAVSITPGPGSFIAITGPSAVEVGTIKPPLMFPDNPVKKITIRTRGGTGTSEFTIKEGFASAFKGDDTKLRVQVSGVPEKATVMVSMMAEGTTLGTKSGDGTAEDPTKYAGMITVDPDDAAASSGKDLNFDIDLTGADSKRSETLKLMLVLNAKTDLKGLEFPLDPSNITVAVTMRPEDKPTAAPHAYFVENYLPSPAPVAFSIAPAQCSMLFPLVFYVPADPMDMNSRMFNTGISIANTNGKAGEESDGSMDGGITFSFFPNGYDSFEHTLNGNSPGQGVNEEGVLAAGHTYIVQASDLLDDAEFMGKIFQGHMTVLTDFINCQGLAIMFDNERIGQSYVPIVTDSDTGMMSK